MTTPDSRRLRPGFIDELGHLPPDCLVDDDTVRAILGDQGARALHRERQWQTAAGVIAAADLLRQHPDARPDTVVRYAQEATTGTRRMARRAQTKQERRQAVAAAKEALGDADPVGWDRVIAARPDVTGMVDRHRWCGRLPATIDRATAVAVVVDGPGRIGPIVPGPDERMDVKTVARLLGIPQAAVTALRVAAGRKATTHDLVDEWTVLANTDRVRFDATVAQARTDLPELRRQARQRRAEAAQAGQAQREQAQAEKDRIAAVRARLGLPADVRYPAEVGTSDVAIVLGLSEGQVRTAFQAGRLPAQQKTVRTDYGRQDRWYVDVDKLAAVVADQPDWLAKALARRGTAAAAAATRAAVQQQSREAERAALAAAAAAVRIRAPVRRTTPESVVAHLGPTNSGKTHDALALLAERRSGVYVAPLRMLVLEAYERLCAVLGPETVGYVTGEGSQNPHAAVVCCTPECAPRAPMDTLVIDEVHWLADPERGWAWTRLLAGADVTHLRLCGAPEAEPLLRQIFADRITVTRHARLAALRFADAVTIPTIPSRSLLVSFSRRSVLSLAREAAAGSGMRVSALYGAMPPAARRDVIARFIDGDLDVLSVTDVIGHGVNLPADHVIFAETEKFDGLQRRALHVWEVAQIAGRAGRYGMSDTGTVRWLRTAALTVSPRLVAAGTHAAAGLRPSDLTVANGTLRPVFADLGTDDPEHLVRHLTAWTHAATTELAAHPWLRVHPTGPVNARIGGLGQHRRAGLGAERTWQIANLPVDSPAAIDTFADAVAFGTRIHLPALGEVQTLRLEDAEATARWARECLVFTEAFGDIGGISHRQAADIEHAASARVTALLPRAVTENRYGRCASCGKECPPWFDNCDNCHHSYDGWV
ncbi:hypothetical protein GCM10010112_13260 [Actinoplanes lobatus]|uniref:Helicase C-terminal domain-containing protein n=1 Tax=Actinoplanes lobatus TaxID=113568 RepID=A0A7W7HMC3_9ACTN|nr:helicase-related protein [Actinoplanes lobatus]MBB4753163.1 hypothetical protein [Actinoplanes lobatus]GGN58950.1 hypothetical protein GCM10010112_13260 [Actinoplanes lobatus]GIE42976.1 hypothetical protein Alo02nite_58740 [Actinoplanes lobatus]